MASTAEADSDESRLEQVAYVGPATAEVLAAADVSAADVEQRRVSYRDLVDAGVNPGVAAKIRREHSLHWSHQRQSDDLDRRSQQVRGLRDGEREWVAAAFSGDDADDEEAEVDESEEEEDAGGLDGHEWPDV